MADKLNIHPEPVPPASQLAVLPFLAAIDGYLRRGGEIPGLRVTMHRLMNREGQEYLQQVCGYMRGDKLESRGLAGRILPVTTGIIGAAYKSRRIWRTKEYSDLKSLRVDLKKDMLKVGDERNPEAVACAYLAIPFLGPEKRIVLILYADCDQLNFFADNRLIGDLVAICNGFARLLDWLQKEPFSNLRNFPLQPGYPLSGTPTLYENVQEELGSINPPQLAEVQSFNYEAAVA